MNAINTAPSARKPIHIRQQEVMAREMLSRIEQRVRAKADEVWAEDVQREIVEQAKLRGAIVERPARARAEGVKPLRVKTGLQWLFERKRITARQLAAGVRYGAAVAAAELPSIKSCMAGMEARVDCGGSAGDIDHLAALARAKRTLAAARVTALRCHPRLVAVCDAVCGRGETVRQVAHGVREAAERHEIELSIALDLLADLWELPEIGKRAQVG